jgi:hypothetical protein
MKLKPILFLLVLVAGKSFAQDTATNATTNTSELLNLVDKEQPQKEYVYGAFKSPRVIMSQSIEMLRPGVLDFRILHRFGAINSGAYEFFGLDGPASVRLGLEYGISNNFSVGLGHSTLFKEFDYFLKYRPVQQSTGPGSTPVSLVLVAGTTHTILHTTDGSFQTYFASRNAYYQQGIIGRKFSEALTLQAMYTLLERDFRDKVLYPNTVHALGFGGRIKISHRVSINADYQYILNQKNSALYNPFSIGFDIETGGHVFQLHFTNSKGMNERAILNGSEYSWGKGDIFFGFNISRSFQIKKKKG